MQMRAPNGASEEVGWVARRRVMSKRRARPAAARGRASALDRGRFSGNSTPLDIFQFDFSLEEFSLFEEHETPNIISDINNNLFDSSEDRFIIIPCI